MCEESACSSCGSGDKRKEDLVNMINANRDIPGALIGVLHKAQGMYGYLPKEVLYEISRGLGIPISEVMGIVTFYSFFSTTPKGKYDVMVCMGTACYVRGADAVLERFKSEFGINVGGTTEDRMFSLTASRCIGACGLAPVVSVSGEIHRQVSDKQVPEIIAQYKGREKEGGH